MSGHENFPAIATVERMLSRVQTPTTILLLLGAIAPLAYGAYLSRAYDNPIDFMVFWTAGDIWRSGGNPYGLSFETEVKARIGTEIRHFWLYSPHIWVLARPTALLDFETAFAVWFWMSVGLYYAGWALLAATVFDLSRNVERGIAVAFLWLTLLSSAAAATLTLGQFSAFAFLGISAFAYGVLKNRPAAMILGLFLVSMKASIGLCFVIYGLASDRWRLPTLAALVLIASTALPAFVAGGIPSVATGYLDAVAAYGTVAPNAPPAITGLRHILHDIWGADVSGVVLALICALVAAAAARLLPPQKGLAILIAAMLFLVPLHIYDLAMVTLLAACAARFSFGALVLLAAIVLFRVADIAELVGLGGASGGNLIASIALGALLFGACLQALHGRTAA